MVPQQQSWRERFRHYHHLHERKLEVFFFCAGFLFDIVATREGVDHLVMIAQQVVYLLVIGVILYLDALREARPGQALFPPRFERLWDYRGLALHFCLGTLMNIYSIFFLMSASFFSSIIFVLLLFGALILNELKVMRKRGVDIKIALFVICMFCFFSLMFPLVLANLGQLILGDLALRNKDGSGFSPVGMIPFFCSFLATLGVIGIFYRQLHKQLGGRGSTGAAALKRKILIPGLSVSGLFLLLYLAGLIPPVPLAAKKLGVYHGIEKSGDDYLLHHERPWWRFWQSGDQDFVARPGDSIYFFVAISSPARFADTVFVRWMFHDPRSGWKGSDRIPLHISGGRKGGFRGFTTKQNFDYGDGGWRVSVETVDGREIGRMYFSVAKGEADPSRAFSTEIY